MAAAGLLAMAPVPVTLGRLLLADRGATPATASLVAVGVAATLLCLVGSVAAAMVADGPIRRRRPARHTAVPRPRRAGRSSP